MEIAGLIWLEDIVEKLGQKHAVRQDEVRQLFNNGPRFFFVERGHREGENVYSACGQTDGGRYLLVLFVYTKGRRALIISARDMTDSERKRYERK